MLSRTASNLYWMTRYLERAESTARLLAACFQPGMPFDGEIKKLYSLPLQIQGVYQEFVDSFNGEEIDVTIESVCKFLISSNSQSSVKTCLEYARENARSERSRLSSDVWEAMNQTWIEFKEVQDKPLNVFTEWLQQRAYLFQGAVNISMPETLSRHFLRLGSFLERADQTLRVLEAKVVLESLSNQSDYYHWHMLLRTVSSFEAYQETVVENPSQERVFKFLLFNKYVPRSVRYCVERVEQLLNVTRAENRRGALKICAQLLMKLKFDDFSDISIIGQEEYIQTLQDEMSSLTTAIQEGCFVIT